MNWDCNSIDAHLTFPYKAIFKVTIIIGKESIKETIVRVIGLKHPIADHINTFKFYGEKLPEIVCRIIESIPVTQAHKSLKNPENTILTWEPTEDYSTRWTNLLGILIRPGYYFPECTDSELARGKLSGYGKFKDLRSLITNAQTSKLIELCMYNEDFKIEDPSEAQFIGRFSANPYIMQGILAEIGRTPGFEDAESDFGIAQIFSLNRFLVGRANEQALKSWVTNIHGDSGKVIVQTPIRRKLTEMVIVNANSANNFMSQPKEFTVQLRRVNDGAAEYEDIKERTYYSQISGAQRILHPWDVDFLKEHAGYMLNTRLKEDSPSDCESSDTSICMPNLQARMQIREDMPNLSLHDDDARISTRLQARIRQKDDWDNAEPWMLSSDSENMETPI